MNYLKQSTAATIKLGPFIDDTDGKTAETALTISQADIRLSKNGGDIAQTHNSAGATHDELGYYNVPLDTTDTGTLGRLLVAVHESGALPVWKEFLVVTANVYDTLCSTDSLDVNVTALANDVITSNAFDESTAYPLKSADTGTTQVARVGADSDTLETLSDEIAAVKAETAAILADTGTDGVVVASIATDAITAAALKADAVTKIQANLALEATLTAIKGAGWVDETLAGINAAINAGFGGDDLGTVLNALEAIKGAGWTNQTLVKIVTDIAAISAGSGATAQEVWEYATRVLTAGTNIDLSALATATDLATVDTVVDAIKAKTDNLPDDPADDSDIDAQLAAIKAETAAILVDTGTTLDTKINTIDGIVDAIKLKTDLIPATLAEAGEYTAAIAAVKSVADDILVDTGELQTDLVDGGRLDLLIDSIITHLTDIKGAGWTAETLAAIDVLIDAIKAKTDNLPASPAAVGSAMTLTPAYDKAKDDVLTPLAVVDNIVDGLKTTLDNIHDTDLPAVKAETALIVEDTGTTIPATLATLAGYTDGIAGDVWSSPIRTLTVPAVAAAATEDGTTLTLYKDADINIEFTGLTIPTGAKKVVFTIKDNLDDADTAAALQATYQLTAVPAETHTLNYINSATPPTLTNPVTFTVTTDSVEFDMTAAAAYYLPRYERGYLHWDLKLITATTVQILQQGLVQILGTSTRTVA